jgi:hypothetical protein
MCLQLCRVAKYVSTLKQIHRIYTYYTPNCAHYMRFYTSFIVPIYTYSTYSYGEVAHVTTSGASLTTTGATLTTTGATLTTTGATLTSTGAEGMIDSPLPAGVE